MRAIGLCDSSRAARASRAPGVLGRAAAVALALALPGACGKEAPPPAATPAARVVVHDLAERAWIAERRAARTLALFGTPGSDAFQEGGLVRADWSAAPAPFVWARRRALIALHGIADDARVLVLDLEPAPGLERQAVRVFLNDAPVARVPLGAVRRGYRLALPAAPAGELRLFFDAAVAPPGSAKEAPAGARRHVAARLFSLTLARPDDPAPALLAPEDPAHAALAPLAVTDERGARRIVQAGSGALDFFVALPAVAALRFAPWVGPAAAGATFRVVSTLEQGPPRVVWSATLPAGTRGRELLVPLPGAAGTPARLSLEIEFAEGQAAAAGWEGAAVMGSAARSANLLDPAPFAPHDFQRADELRARLRGTNVVFVILDAARARSFSCYGAARRTTPEIDRLASEGVLFERAYTPAVFTLSAMASVWTSLPSLEHHAGLAYDDALPPGPPTLAELLGAHGVHAAGFIANSMAGPAYGLARGFAEFDEVHLRLGNRAAALMQVLPAWLRAQRQRGGRFFLYVHVREPHFPYDPQPPFDTLFGPDGPLGRRERTNPAWYGDVNDGLIAPTAAQLAHLERLYDGNLAYADRQVGALRRTLEEQGLLERTLLIVASDHGEALHEHGFIGHNQQVFEESTHVPLIVRFPNGSGPAGTRVRELVDLLDVAPTVADVFGLSESGPARGFRGRSLLPVALGAPGKAATYAVSTGDLRGFGLRQGRFKYVRNVHFDVERLFDLEADPGEGDDLAVSQPVRAGYYRHELHRHILNLLRGVREREARPKLTREQIENLKSLGYLN